MSTARRLAIMAAAFALVACTPRGPLVSAEPSPARSSPSASPSASPSIEVTPSPSPQASPSPGPAGPGMWMRWKLMSAPRADFTATVLPSGKVLLAGGLTSLNTPVTATADLFDPTTNGITPAAPMKSPRSGHTATLLPNGKVLLTGGGGAPGAPALASAELYDTASNTWSAAASMAYPRIHHTALLMWNGKVFVIGGSAQTAAAEVYDPGTNTWTTVAAPTNTPRPLGPTAIQLPEGHVIIVGGANGGAVTASSDCLLYTSPSPRD